MLYNVYICYVMLWCNVIKGNTDFKGNKGNIYYLDWVQAKQLLLNEVIKKSKKSVQAD